MIFIIKFLRVKLLLRFVIDVLKCKNIVYDLLYYLISGCFILIMGEYYFYFDNLRVD